MARLNSDAREILCNMVTEKASGKRSALVAELDGIDASLHKEYKKRLANARAEIDRVVHCAQNKINTILGDYRLQWKAKRYGNGFYNIGCIISDNGELTSNLEVYIAPPDPAKEAVKRRENLKQDIEELDAAVAKAKQEILLRAALGMKYDEVVGIINSFQF